MSVRTHDAPAGRTAWILPTAQDGTTYMADGPVAAAGSQQGESR